MRAVNTIQARNVNEALSEGFQWLRVAGVKEESRNGPVIVAPAPVCTTYLKPHERVLFNPVRDANPVFHLMEAVWMLAGSNDVAFPELFNSKFRQYAESNGRVWGAYGYRWRSHFQEDQIGVVIGILQKNPQSRQAVMQMWDCDSDLGGIKNDLPCNTHIYFDCRGGKLNMTVCNRSNDILWGAYGANAVHMSMLQEVVAAGVGVPMGMYRQFSNNFHAYTDNDTVRHFLENGVVVYDRYAEGLVAHMPLIGPNETVEMFLTDCELLVSSWEDINMDIFNTKFFSHIAFPLFNAYLARKDEGHTVTVLGFSRGQLVNDWVTAFVEWCERRAPK